LARTYLTRSSGDHLRAYSSTDPVTAALPAYRRTFFHGRAIFADEYHESILGYSERHGGWPDRHGGASVMPKISVEVPAELLEDLDRHVGADGKFVNRSEAVRASIRKTLDILDDIDARHGRLDDEATDRGDESGGTDGD
jgi:Arc/MetJ-type ribon-helix-helix transcriptional regulator